MIDDCRMAIADSNAKRVTRPKRQTTAPSAQAPSLDPSLLRRVVVENVRPQVDCGRFPIKRTVGEAVRVTADIHADGHDFLAAVLLYRRVGNAEWTELPMTFVENDRW